DSEVSAVNRGEDVLSTMSPPMREVLDLAELTRHETHGYFDVRRPDGRLDPSGLVKGWAIRNAARLIEAVGLNNYCLEAGGDIQCRGYNEQGQRWRVGIRNPFVADEIVKVLMPGDAGVATSGTYVRGKHIYDPHADGAVVDDVASLTVIGPDIYEADRFATAAFAMGMGGIAFIEDTPGLEAYAIDRGGVATMTSGFKRFVAP
ncbi:MAG TPA: FAD:protein FMN transferase, partial [Devosia sp.]|nr:FAD:protein FMN transferase [Devosia sp.]